MAAAAAHCMAAAMAMPRPTPPSCTTCGASPAGGGGISCSRTLSRRARLLVAALYCVELWSRYLHMFLGSFSLASASSDEQWPWRDRALKKHPTLPFCYTINAKDKKMVNDFVKARSS